MDPVEEVIALNKIKNIQKIQGYEKKYHQLGYMPFFLFIITIVIFLFLPLPTLIRTEIFYVPYFLFIIFIMFFQMNEKIKLLKMIFELKFKDSI
ncbi:MULTISPECIES: hypothetical protein [unclassified Colwellia]|uniref:hypothetical protein n=1 Tax=unclassified Colwellia TaxID=196834 RepID=UPI0015F42D2E|nr:MULTISPECIES: hypothetical protein [unclassified Colwellia]MBA6230588.1 hypothetical protein [Colwellia sp. MB02u-7]MBA6236602.1 hypothetical protein [Colwellia sp. MB02u-11]MBA6261985.1 hypothetical protein [Colwellia sp. MB3u-41]MBA6297951.1 hypothetical protein [Colwellia sp. MB3u-22]MBA6313139.1 hypothetical protein [Colwellia sp. MB3u-64]